MGVRVAVQVVALELVMEHALPVAGKHVLGVALAVQNHAVHNVPTVVVEDVSNIVQVTVLVTVMVALTHANIHV